MALPNPHPPHFFPSHFIHGRRSSVGRNISSRRRRYWTGHGVWGGGEGVRDNRGLSPSREPTQHGVLAWLAGGQGWKSDDVYCDARAVPVPAACCTEPPVLAGAAQLRPIGNPCCCYVYKCTQNTDITETTQGRQGPTVYVRDLWPDSVYSDPPPPLNYNAPPFKLFFNPLTWPVRWKTRPKKRIIESHCSKWRVSRDIFECLSEFNQYFCTCNNH